MTTREPQSAADYEDRTTAAVKSVLIEIGQILGSYKGKFTVIGGAVPWLLLNNDDMPHVGTLDIDLDLDSTALGDGEYATLVESLQGCGYEQREGVTRAFQLVRTIPASDDGPAIDIIIDFLRPRDAELVKNAPPLISNFAVQRADGADLALKFYEMVAISGAMPEGGKNTVEIAVCSIPALLAMKGYALNGRHKQKILMIFITAFVTMRMGRKRLLKSASLYLLKKVGPSDTDTLHKNSTRWKVMVQPASESLLKRRNYLGKELPNSGNKMHLVR